MKSKFPYEPHLVWYEIPYDNFVAHCLNVGFFYIDIKKENGKDKWEVAFNDRSGDVTKSFKPFNKTFKDLKKAKLASLNKAQEQITKISDKIWRFADKAQAEVDASFKF